MTAARSRRAINRLLLAIAMLLSLWPAAVVAKLATSGHITLPRIALPSTGVQRAANALELEIAERSLSTDAQVLLDDTPQPDVAARAMRLRAQARDWSRRQRGGRHAASAATAMLALDDAIAAFALAPSPATRLAFDRSLQSYNAVVSDGAPI